jgi:hypothetical protein
MRAVVFAVLAAATACGPSAVSHPDAPPAPDAPDIDAPPITTVRELRMHPPAAGSIVTLPNLVVVVHVSSRRNGSVWVQDAGGGPYSGIHVFCNYGGTTPNCSMTQAQVDALAVGTVVTVSGTYQTFLGTGAPAGAVPELELDAPTISTTGDTMQPAALDVAASDVAKGTVGASSDPYKGAYIHVTGAASWTASTVMPSEMTGTCSDQSMPPQTGSQYSGFEATGASETLAVGVGFHDTLTYCLPCTGVPMPYPCGNAVTANQTFTTVRGIVEADYNSNGAVYLRISPVLDSDL